MILIKNLLWILKNDTTIRIMNDFKNKKSTYASRTKFKTINLDDIFFDSLKKDYPGFEKWFHKKEDEFAIVIYDEQKNVNSFLYLKDETEEIKLKDTILPKKRRQKVGTFKINSTGEITGERFIAYLLRSAIFKNFEETYVTVFPKQEKLINTFEKFGFKKSGIKENGEFIFIKNFLDLTNNEILYRFPIIEVDKNVRFFGLGIIPKYHSELFDDLMLDESSNEFNNKSNQNTVTKTYLTSMKGVENLKKDDLILNYKTSTGTGNYAGNTSKITGVSTILDIKNISNFSNYEEFKKFIGRGTVFSDDEIVDFWKTKKYPIILKFIYNFPLLKNMYLNDLRNIIGEKDYWGFFEIDNFKEFKKILDEGDTNESFIINKT